MADQVEVVRGTLSKAAAEMAGRKEKVTELSAQIDDRKSRLDKAKKRLAQQERALERSYSHMGDLEKSAKQMEELHEQEATRVKQTDKELGVLKDRMFNEGQKLFELRQQEATLLAEISGAQRVSRNASSKLKQLDEEYAADHANGRWEPAACARTRIRVCACPSPRALTGRSGSASSSTLPTSSCS
jgi:chromosome segregation ATPase